MRIVFSVSGLSQRHLILLEKGAGGVFVVAGIVLAVEVELFQSLQALARQATEWQLDAIFSALIAFVVILTVVSVSRGTAMRREMLRRAAAEAREKAIARHDALTGLANRRALLEHLARDPNCLSIGDLDFACLLIGLDRFSLINDVHGRQAGDLVLREIAGRLRGLCPVTDNALLALVEGDVFACVLQFASSSPAPAPIRLAAQIVQAAAAPIVLGDLLVQTNASIGISAGPVGQTSPDEWLRRANIAMSRAKRSGGSTFCSYEPAMDSELKLRASLETELRGALANDEIIPYYQPILRVHDGVLIGFEALARWIHPSRGLLLPNLFIPVAEDAGLIDELSFALLRLACMDARHWPPHITLSINISPVQLKNERLVERLLQILVETGFRPGRLIVELTESGIIDDLGAARKMITSLTNAGSEVALDDFGTGYSSLYHLRELRFSRIKIDQSFVKNITQHRDKKLVRAMIGLAHNLGLPVTAEGVEDEQSLRILKELGCDNAQGFLLGRPTTPSKAMDMLINCPARYRQRAAAR